MTTTYTVQIKPGDRMACDVSYEQAQQIIKRNAEMKPSGKKTESPAAEAARSMRIVETTDRATIEAEAARTFATLRKMDTSPSRVIK